MKLKVGQTSDGQIDARDVWYVPMFGDGQTDSFVIGAASTPCNITLAEGHWYIYSGNVDSWVKQGAAGVAASKAAGSLFVQKGQLLLIDGSHGVQIAAIEDAAAAGLASLMEVTIY